MKFENIANQEDLKIYLDDTDETLKHYSYLYHYTNLGFFVKICTKNTLKFSPLKSMNDRFEYNTFYKYCDKKFFCLMKSHSENIGMWAMYGGITEKQSTAVEKPETIGVKICFPRETIKKLLNENVTAHSVAYINFKQDKSSKTIPEYKYKCGSQVTKESFNFDKKELAGYLKDIAWTYESEFRLSIDKSEDDIKKFSTDFLKDILVIPSPHFSKDECKEKFEELSKGSGICMPKFKENTYIHLIDSEK